MSEQVYHNGPIEGYEVRDISTGETAQFRSFDEADLTFTKWQFRPGHQIEFVAVIAS